MGTCNDLVVRVDPHQTIPQAVHSRSDLRQRLKRDVPHGRGPNKLVRYFPQLGALDVLATHELHFDTLYVCHEGVLVGRLLLGIVGFCPIGDHGNKKDSQQER